MADEVESAPVEKDSVAVSFQCPKELYDKLSKEAEDEDRNISQQVRRIVRKYYESQGVITGPSVAGS